VRLVVACVVALVVAGCGTPASPAATAPASAAAVSASPTAAALAGLVFDVPDFSGKATIRIREQLFEWPAPDDAVLTTDGITGAFGLRDDGTFADGSLLRVPLITLKSDDDRRADAARETMNADRFRDATVKPVRATGLTLPLPATGSFEFTLDSRMTVNGLEREVRWDVTAERTGRDLNVRARTAFKFGLFGMEPPRRGPVLSIVDEIRMEISLVAKARA
jgi:polyisoprenoid-binding protein YceI